MRFRLVEDFLSESKADEQRLIDFAGEDVAKRFLKLKQRFKSPENDLYYWIKNKTPQELEQAVSNLENTKSNTQQRKENVSGAELVSETEHWKIYYITTFEASQYYGRDTKWCITGVGGYGDEYWEKYTDNGIEFYFIITKQDYDARGTKSKFAIGVHPQSDSYEIYNQQDCKCRLDNIPYWEEVQIPDMDLSKMYDDFQFSYFCHTCGLGLPEYEVYFGTDDEPYCSDCFNERYFTCERCYETYELEDQHETANGEYVCEWCLEQYFGECDVCGGFYPQKDLVEIDGQLICDNCQKDSTPLEEDYLDPEEKFYDFKTPEIVGDKIFADTTGTSYDNLLVDPKYYAKAKNLVGSIKMMTPREYFTECGRVVFNRTFDSMVKGWSQDTERLDPIRTVIHKYKKQLCMPYINYANPGQEGLHRMMVAAELYGWDYKFPVLVIDWLDKDLAEQEAKEKRYNKIKRLIEEAVEETLSYHFNDMSEVENQLEWELDKVFENKFDEPLKSFNIIYDDKTVEVSVEDVVYQFDTDRINVKPSIENSDNVDELEWDDLDIELDDLSDEEIKDLNDLDIDEFLKKYGL